MRILAYLVLVLTLAGCGVQREYVWVQAQNGFAMAAPIKHSVRIRVDPAAQTVSWLENVTDKNGASDQQLYDFTRAECRVFDASNWTCEKLTPDYNTYMKAQMKDDELTRDYFGSHQTFEKHYSFLGFGL